MLSNPFLHSLLTEHASLAIGTSPALRFPAEVIPFAALSEPTPDAMLALATLLAPGEIIYLTGDHIPSVPEVEYLKQLPCWQYHYPAQSALEHILAVAESSKIRALTAADSPAMVALTDIAFPGYFRPRAHLLGPFYGIHAKGELIAMAGTRVCLPGHREISAVCTHPTHIGQGHAAALIRHLIRENATTGLRSFLHVLAANHRAIALYERLGFVKSMPVLFHQLRRR